MDIEATLSELETSGNLRRIPAEESGRIVDLSSNDYLGVAADKALRERFFAETPAEKLVMSSSASRLLGACQKPYSDFEAQLSHDYGHGRSALLFNSGYHANTGLVSAIADKSTLILADRLVHASIIDGIKLSGAPFARFAHNDYEHLKRLLQTKAADYNTVLIIVESVYSMDGDSADLGQIAELKKLHRNALLYVDEAHAVGIHGPGGLGETARLGLTDDVDIIVGTLGKALASMGAYAILTPRLREFMVNKARSLIFSTALPPVQILWSLFVWRHITEADSLRDKLMHLSELLAKAIPGGAPSHIRPLITGDPVKAVQLSKQLLADGFKVLPIRTPTVPPGTERLRFVLSASIDAADIQRLSGVLQGHLNKLY